MAEKKEEMMEEVLEDLEKDAAEKQAEEVSEAEETETETETEAAVPDARTSLSPKVLASHLKSKLMTFAMHHMALFILCMLVAFALFTLILIWLYRVLKRSYHRRKYKRLRNERIKKNVKNK